jgi:hypothetical protein
MVLSSIRSLFRTQPFQETETILFAGHSLLVIALHKRNYNVGLGRAIGVNPAFLFSGIPAVGGV